MLVEFSGCDDAVLNDARQLGALLGEAVRAAGATPVAEVFHPFAPQGVTGVVVLAESHLSIHTWPEARYAAVDFYTCGDTDIDRAIEVLAAGVRAQRAETLEIARGRQAAEAVLDVTHRGRREFG